MAPAGGATRAVLEAWAAGGVEIAQVEDAGVRLHAGGVVWGPPEAWLSQWRLLSEARAAAQVVIDAACAPEYRAITGARELPPYARPHARRAWLCSAGGSAGGSAEGTATRVVLPAGAGAEIQPMTSASDASGTA